jgi:predicted nuclease of predicted toxin-antitoxin system
VDWQEKKIQDGDFCLAFSSRTLQNPWSISIVRLQQIRNKAAVLIVVEYFSSVVPRYNEVDLEQY